MHWKSNMAAPSKEEIRLEGSLPPPDQVFKSSEDHSLCKLCLKQYSRYTCPRCNIAYCSLSCYRSEKHEGCSEQFYKEHIIEELKQQRGSHEEKQKVLEMLKRLEDQEEEEEEEEEEDEQTLEDRLHGLDLDRDTEAIWDQLTDQERAEFQSVVEKGMLGEMLEMWTPWWSLSQEQASLIEEVGTQQDSVTKETEIRTNTNSPPALMAKIPKLSSLLKGQPSESIKYNIVNILHCYAYVVRLHNGDHFTVPRQAAQELLQLCPVFTENSCYGCVGEALHAAMSNQLSAIIQESKRALGWLISILDQYFLQDPSLANTVSFQSLVVKDVSCILIGPSKEDSLRFVQAALSDLHQLFSVARKKVEKDASSTDQTEEGPISPELRQKLFLCKKKCEFLLAWCGEHGTQLTPLAMDCSQEYASLRREFSQHEKTKSELEKVWGGSKPPKKEEKTLIQELS
ncbi:PREDICTED: zinc finger HIT domain-containing protein 2-like [Branchiostoma belcheri]|uniref:Zinc finger HIT domain-containing protein 2-like n=1 Tax=Branchiostoma belcheri TaxID=7741 RepID=A0A6P4ZK47_BRABE|nr:PREDICTED: zinc finger HIT domain-containing protein 2-like [Branchiostoma belcheri]